MSKVFVECQWFINGSDIDEILRLSHVLECEIWRKGTFVYDEGYLLIPVFISADAEEIIKIFCETVQPHARFVHCKLTSPTDFQREKVEEVGHGVSHARWEQLLEYWYAHNKRIEKGFAFWIYTLWPVQSVNLKTLTEVINLAETSEISIYYRTAQHLPRSFELYFKVFSYHQFDVKFNEIRKYLAT